ncbi:MFS domain-containing protein [Sergentomyia squamirostris]
MDKSEEIQNKLPDSTQNLGIGCSFNDISHVVQPKLSWNILNTRRFMITILGMIGFVNVYTLRSSLSVAIVAMTAKTNHTLQNGTMTPVQEFTWTSEQQGIILSSFFYGYVWTQIIGGVLAAKFGGNIFFGIGIGVSSVFMMISPLAAKHGLYYFITVRILIGLCQGAIYSSMQEVLANWSPRYERTAISSFVHAGAQMGTFVSFLLSGLFADRFGWESIFYIFGSLGVIWYILWAYLVKRRPSTDPRITTAEKNYIESNVDASNIYRKDIPWITLFTSKPVIALTIADLCEAWSNFTFLSMIPRFLTDVLKSDLGTTGILAAAPYLIHIVFSAGVGISSDYLRSRNILTTQQVRKVMIGFGFTICAILTVIMASLNDPAAIIACLILTISFSALMKVAIRCNALDFAPDYCSIIMGIVTTFGSISGTIAPIVAGYIVKTGSHDEWKIVFYISASFCILGMIVFTAFGQGTIQSWAKPIKPNSLQREVTSEGL